LDEFKIFDVGFYVEVCFEDVVNDMEVSVRCFLVFVGFLYMEVVDWVW